ncbi:MAG: AAA family ATPase [Anaerolineales bacterium]
MIQLRKIKYAEGEGTPQEWTLDDLSLAESNLVVGKNATGKSRTLNIISFLAEYLAGLRALAFSGNYDVEYVSDNKIIRYILKFKNQQVIAEEFSLDGKLLLNRGDGGEGTIWAEAIDGGKEIRFQTPTSELAVVARQDNIQHKFLEPLYSWGSSLRHYSFGLSLGKYSLMVAREKGGEKGVDDRDTDYVVALYRQASEEFGDAFKNAVIKDMGLANYSLKDVGIGPLVSFIRPNMPSDLVGLYVKETDLPGITDQPGMSQGMFRALSLLIQINYLQMTGKSTCIIVDDIGEGLDFDRSCRLIDILREKAKTSNTQLILSTNDRFVMNRVPLEEWSLLQRKENHVRVLNYRNSKDLFEEFKFTGLSNFTFLEMDFASGPQEEE